MATLENPTGKVPDLQSFPTNPEDRDVYICIETGGGYEWRAERNSWDYLGQVESEGVRAEKLSQGEAPSQQAVTVGGTIAATTTIDAILTSILPTRSSDLAATPVYTWASAQAPWELHATWVAATAPSEMVAIRFEVRNVAPSSIGP